MKHRMGLWGSLSIVGLVFGLMVSPATWGAGPDPQKVSAVLKAGGGAVGGVGYMVMTGMSKVVRGVYPKMDITVVPGGWVGNLFRVNTGEMDIGSTTTAMCSLAAANKAPFDKPLPEIRSLYSTQDRLYYFAIVRKDAPVNTLKELFEKKPPLRLCTIQKGTTTELMWRNVFDSQGAGWDEIAKWGGKINFVAWGDGVNLVKDGHADGILAVGVQKIGWAMDLINAREMKILKWDPDLLDMLKKKFGFDRDPIPANTYPGITEEIVCPTDAGSIIVNAKLPDMVVEALLTALADRDKEYQQHHKALADFTAQGMAKGLLLPLHPAAEKFYKSRNIPIE